MVLYFYCGFVFVIQISYECHLNISDAMIVDLGTVRRKVFSRVSQESEAIFTVGARGSSDRCIPKYQNSTGVKFPIALGATHPRLSNRVGLINEYAGLNTHSPMYRKIAPQSNGFLVFFPCLS